MNFLSDGSVQLNDATTTLSNNQKIFQSVFGNNVNLDPTSPNGLIIQQLTNSNILVDNNISYLYGSINPFKAIGLALDDVVGNLGIVRKIQQPAKMIFNFINSSSASYVLPNNLIVTGQNSSAGNIYPYPAGNFSSPTNLPSPTTIPANGTLQVTLYDSTDRFVNIAPNQVWTTSPSLPSSISINNNNITGVQYQFVETDFELLNRFVNSRASASNGSFVAVFSGLSAYSQTMPFICLKMPQAQTLISLTQVAPLYLLHLIL